MPGVLLDAGLLTGRDKCSAADEQRHGRRSSRLSRSHHLRSNGRIAVVRGSLPFVHRSPDLSGLTGGPAGQRHPGPPVVQWITPCRVRALRAGTPVPMERHSNYPATDHPCISK